jgi:hypothetical protein
MLTMMNVRFGDTTVGGAKLLVDATSIGVASGVYTSRSFDAGQLVTWLGIDAQPVGAGLSMSLRTSVDGVAWTPWGAPAGAAPGRYVQYRLDLMKASPADPAPVVKDVVVNYQR